MQKPLDIIKGDFNFHDTLQRIESVKNVEVSLDGTSGLYSFDGHNLLFKSRGESIVGYKNIKNKDIRLIIADKCLSEDLCAIAGLKRDTDEGQWVLIRAEAVLFDDKFKVKR